MNDTTKAVELSTNEAGFAISNITVSKKNAATGKHEPVGKVDIGVPLLKAFGFDAEIESIGEDALPVYKDEKADWLFSAVVAAVKAKARNALVSGTAELKPEASIAMDFEALLAEGKRGGGAEALAVVRDLKAKMSFWIASVQKKSAGTCAFIQGLFANRQALSLQSEANRTKMVGYINDFAGWLAEEDLELLEKGQKYLDSLLAAAEVQATTDDF
jgi:hypothetical protein